MPREFAADRPGSALVLNDALSGCPSAGEWTTDAAAGWWHAHGADVARARPGISDPEALTVAVDISAR